MSTGHQIRQTSATPSIRAPTPAVAARLSVRKVERLLREHRIRRINAEQVVERLRRPALPVLPGVVEAGADRVAVLVPRLHLVYRQLRECQDRIQTMLGELGSELSAGQTNEHRDVLILRSLPGSGRYGIATMLAEAYSVLRSRDYRLLRALCGTAPVTKQSGKHRAVHIRHACNPRLRNAMHHWAWNAILHDAPYRALYDAMRSRGLKHPRAVRGVADRLLKLMIVLLQNGSQYDPARRTLQAAA